MSDPSSLLISDEDLNDPKYNKLVSRVEQFTKLVESLERERSKRDTRSSYDNSMAALSTPAVSDFQVVSYLNHAVNASIILPVRKYDFTM